LIGDVNDHHPVPGRSFFHGTKAALKQGDLIKAGHNSNYGKRAMAAYVYLTGTLNAAIWGAELAFGEEPARIYVVEALALLKMIPT
jgi:Rifampin ADP-ribosyl transferase